MDSVQLLNLVKKIEKDLYRINTELNNLQNLKETIPTLYDSLQELETAIADKKTNAEFRNQLKDREILPLLKKIGNQFSDLKKFSESVVEKNFKAEVFLEAYRTNRSYYFPTVDKSIEFLEQVYGIFSIDSMVFKPNFIGLLNLNAISKNLSIELESNQALKVKSSDLKPLMDSVLQMGKGQAFKFEAESMKLFWKNPQSIQIETANDKIKRLDILCKSVGGNYSD